MERIAGQGCGREVQVLGIGHLAAAVRLELVRRGFDRDVKTCLSPLLLACSDFENASSFKEIARLSVDPPALLLFASLANTPEPPRALARQNAIKVVDRVAHWLAKAQ